MTQEEKDLLLQDLCARLPYGVKVQVDLQSNNYPPIICKVINIEYSEIGSAFIGVETSPDTYNEFREFLCKPYLFPLSSMTEEQYYEMMSCSSEDCLDHMEMSKSLRECTDFTHWPLYEYRVIDWLNKNHFDYRGLIKKGLAIDATGLNMY